MHDGLHLPTVLDESDRLKSRGFEEPETPSHAQDGGEGGIRTPEALARLAVFKTAAFDRSATSPLAAQEPLA
jgi:hypothetical protein